MSRIRSREEITSHQSGDQWAEKKYTEADLKRVRRVERERCAEKIDHANNGIWNAYAASDNEIAESEFLRVAELLTELSKAIRATPESEGE